MQLEASPLPSRPPRTSTSDGASPFRTCSTTGRPNTWSAKHGRTHPRSSRCVSLPRSLKWIKFLLAEREGDITQKPSKEACRSRHGLTIHPSIHLYIDRFVCSAPTKTAEKPKGLSQRSLKTNSSFDSSPWALEDLKESMGRLAFRASEPSPPPALPPF